jgi:hypothetical protein
MRRRNPGDLPSGRYRDLHIPHSANSFKPPVASVPFLGWQGLWRSSPPLFGPCLPSRPSWFNMSNQSCRRTESDRFCTAKVAKSAKAREDPARAETRRFGKNDSPSPSASRRLCARNHSLNVRRGPSPSYPSRRSDLNASSGCRADAARTGDASPTSHFTLETSNFVLPTSSLEPLRSGSGIVISEALT